MKPLSDSDTLLHAIYHVFLPPKIPQEGLSQILHSQVDQRLVQLTLEAIEHYRKLTSHNVVAWNSMHRMLSRLAQNTWTSVAKDKLAQDMASMDTGDVLALHIREQNAAVLVRKNATNAVFENFEVQPPNEAVMSVPGKLVRRFPGPTIQIPNSAFNDPGFLQETSNFLVQMSDDVLDDSAAKTTKAGSTVVEVRDSADPHYISELFVAILRGVGQEFETTRVVKRIADEVLWNDTYIPWRRSPLWLIIRVALQTSLASTSEYKHFMVFLHAHLLHICYNNPSFSDDLLFVMRAKLARRLLKVQDSAPQFLLNPVNDIVTRTEELLQARCARIRTTASKLAPLRLDPESALIQSLPNTRQQFTKAVRAGPNVQQPPFVPNHVPRLLGRSNFAAFGGDALRDASVLDKHIALFDFENAVFNDLSTWVGSNRRNKSTCALISSCLEEYVSVADSLYTHDVADRSIMILTVMALWVALDRLVTAQHALLLDYSPEIPENIIDVLLLRSSQHLNQARDIQLYLRRRHADSKAAARGSIFAKRPTSDSFAVRFFDQSPGLQALMREIEENARFHREKKREELNDLNQQHARLQRRIQALSCRCPTTTEGYRHPQDRCERCQTKMAANRMVIKVHEWPLPSDQLAAKMVVFELRCPEAVKIWRSGTYFILCDLGGSSRDASVTQHHRILADYAGLTKWTSQLAESANRITIASSTKSFLHSHYGYTLIPASESSVCPQNGLTFGLFDSERHVWATGPFIDASFAKYGTFLLQEGSPYQYLQHSLGGTSHTSNQIIASQSDCPQGISLHEHYAFGTLRSGPRLQWMNIARGLEESCLSFNRAEVDSLHAQAAWQIGPLSQNDTSRDWHLELNDPQYGRRLVAQAQRLLDRVKGSWLESTSVRTIGIVFNPLKYGFR
ncbi:hypothetical protein FRC10_005236 [Ceratobasidium sp. 414]|nr:hypothetical protein FRC10_005236 [Ceratobasidium sp. 414]